MSQNRQVLLRSVPTYRELARPVVARVETLVPGSMTPWHCHDWWQLSWAFSGVLSLSTRQATFIAPPQRAIWIPPGIEHQAHNVSQTEMRSLYVARELVPEDAGARCRVLGMTPLIRELIVAVSGLPPDYATEGPDWRMIQVLLDQLLQRPELAFDLPHPEDGRLLGICQRLQQTPDDPRTLEEWAHWAGLSARNLSRLFMQQTGISFGDWRQRLRLLLALEALERGDRVTHVALDSGYQSPSAFIAAFRRTFGMTPSAMFKRVATADRQNRNV
ncbi:MAG: AraC family transcriptional regulator [Candidatus Dactylopiibacterium carminicum]|uniref:AraC family transcriptional regulator n=1 Tax=Candidatus Dactylopiibacterium carminicum TaxID=857335 RepID=A0A272ER86_9RHOO|nr:helix-turn-helix transcriptional regulator [Candidatus Dactylopiibacterium carminicum]KAF7598745.1 AraC family transcriptional regulator [Candidatus Dactylopiibacterium carminicum]PAS92584.1 MAG: AraC family transcriptional regulator [Candidatus Dactylopiibacterium carminicum]PAS93883.1 MAG: AraC family transcriptional regulator [Candidatus Dactylopiibacterium carminicum]PAS98765.1 MAG: AraC family transcriptional regulator [Candidatus Dactylopiibacterium carminicum]